MASGSKNFIFTVSLSFLLLVSGALPLYAEGLKQAYDHSAWDQFLKKFVSPEGQVNYQEVRNSPEQLNAYLDAVAKLSAKEVLEEWPREEQLALFLNLYHAGVIRHVAEHYPIKTIQEIPGVWDLPVIQLGKLRISLNQIRDNFLIQNFRDEKIDTVLACGAKSCPRLSQEAYTGPRVEGQLYLKARAFVNDPVFNSVVPGKKQIKISRIFKWYANNFRLDFGQTEKPEKFTVEENAVVRFLSYYSDTQDKIQYLEQRNYKIKYLPFDWSLNDWRPEA